MKRTFSHVLPAIPGLMILSFLFIAAGCSKNNNSSSSTGSGLSTNQSMSASFSGTGFQPSLIAAYQESTNISVAGLVLNAGDSIETVVTFPDTAPVDTVLNFSETQITYSDSKGTFNFASSNLPSHGTVKITGIDQTRLLVAGTFSGVLYDNKNDSVVVTGGQFNSAYTVL